MTKIQEWHMECHDIMVCITLVLYQKLKSKQYRMYRIMFLLYFYDFVHLENLTVLVSTCTSWLYGVSWYSS